MPFDETVRSLEDIIERELGRNVEALGREARGGLLGAALSIANHRDPAPVILTGAFMPWSTPPAAETDGPIGTAELAIGLREAGSAVRVCTDAHCEDVVRAALSAADPTHGIPVDVVPDSEADAAVAGLANRYRDEYGVTHVVAIERLGPAADGRVYDMSGRDISRFTAPLHELFAMDHWTSIGIGDGGNELGMGSLATETVDTAVELGSRIHCTVPCDHLIVSTTSNWGAQALLVAIALSWEDRAEAMLTHFSATRDIAILEQLVRNGPAVDGVTQEQTPSVDGILPADLARTVNDLLAAVGKGGGE